MQSISLNYRVLGADHAGVDIFVLGGISASAMGLAHVALGSPEAMQLNA